MTENLPPDVDQRTQKPSETGILQSPEILSERRGNVALITVNRPESLNALSVEMREPLLDAFGSASKDPDVGAIVITGSGRGFSSGGDITFMQSVMQGSGRFEDFRALVDSGRDLALAIDKIEKPVIAAVNGAAAGGGMGLALMCDIRWASDKAKFGQSFVRIGLHPDWSSLYNLPRLIGPSRALELMWTGDLIDAAEALRLGIVSRVLPVEQLLPETVAFAERLANGPAIALREIKRSVRGALGYTLKQALEREIKAQERCWNSRDAREGFESYLAKREPDFTGC